MSRLWGRGEDLSRISPILHISQIRENAECEFEGISLLAQTIASFLNLLFGNLMRSGLYTGHLPTGVGKLLIFSKAEQAAPT